MSLEAYYQKQKLVEFLERIKKADAKILESLEKKIIQEAINEEDLKAIGKVVQVLRGLIPQGLLPSYDQALQTMNAELQKVTAGGLKQKIVNFFTPEFAQPLTRIMGFAVTARTAFQQFRNILAPFIGTEPELNKTVVESVPDDASVKRLEQTILNSIKPSGIYNVFSAIPYVKNPKAFAQELMNLKVKDVYSLSDKAKQTNLQTAGLPKPEEQKQEIQAASNPQSQQQTTGQQSNKQPENSAEAINKRVDIVQKVLNLKAPILAKTLTAQKAQELADALKAAGL